jgi:hypothetical protein
MSLQESLQEVVDFRKRNKNFRHELLDILLLSVCAVLSGAEDYGEIALYGQKKEVFCGVFYACPTGFLLMTRFAACLCIWMKRPSIKPLSPGSATLFVGSIGT